MNGLKIQWGTYSAGTASGWIATQKLPIAYSNTKYFVCVTPNSTSDNGTFFYNFGRVLDETKFDYHTAGLTDCRWFTIGY